VRARNPAHTSEAISGGETSPRPEPPSTQKFNNLQKFFYPKDGVTKGDVIQYYDDVAEFILPHLADRPLSLKRYPNGIHAQYFFQKNVADKKFPEWIRTGPIESESQDHIIHYVICNDKPTLLYLANLGCIDQNPWMSRVGSLDNPDFVLIDLDPYECSYDQIIEAALLTREALKEIGLEGYPKTTGGDGMHIYIPARARLYVRTGSLIRGGSVARGDRTPAGPLYNPASGRAPEERAGLL
jgi:bifunctional non-homologous end joining protein LigD